MKSNRFSVCIILALLVLLPVLSIAQGATDKTSESRQSAPPNTLSQKEARQGFALLFDGKSLENFKSAAKAAIPEGCWLVKEGQIIGLLNGKLIVAAPNLEEACLSLLKKIEMDEFELITMFYGNNIKSDQVDQIAGIIQETYPDHEVEIQAGEQPHYQFIFSIE